MKKFKVLLSVLLSLMIVVSALPATMVSLAETEAEVVPVLTGGKATASFSEKGAVPSNAIDGDVTTRWSSYGSTLPAAIMIDTEATITVEYLEILMFQNGRSYDLEFYLSDKATVSAAGAIDLTGATKIGSGNFSGVGTGKENPDLDSVFDRVISDSDATGRYFTVYCTSASSGTAVALWEVQAYGTTTKSSEPSEPPVDDPVDTSVSLFDDARASASFSQKGADASNAIDGDITTRWSSSGGDLPAALMIDTEATISVDYIEILMFQNNRNYNLEFYLSDEPTVSADGAIDITGATAIGSGTFSGIGNGATTPELGTTLDKLAIDSDATGRYFTVYCTSVSSGTAAALWELQAYGTITKNSGSTDAPSGDPIETNAALLAGGDAFAKFTQSGYSPANAIDGNITTRWSSFGDTLPAVLMFDTYKLFNVEYIDVLAFQSGRTYDLEFYVSDQPTLLEDNTIDLASAVKIAAQTIEGVGNGSTKPSDDSATVRVSAETAAYGRYFTVYCAKASSGTAAALWEIEAYGNVYGTYSRNIINIERIAPVSVPYGTTDISYYLPKAVEILVDGEKLSSTAVTWDTTKFDGTKVGSVVLNGTINDAAANVNNLAPEITVIVRSAEEDTAIRQQFTINDNWLYYQGDVENGQAVDLDTAGFNAVSLPHTFNKYDGQDGGGEATAGNYYKGLNWYRKTLVVDERYQGKNVKLYFEGVSRTCEVYVNGTLAGSHDGSFTAFEIDITSLIKTGENTIAVKVDNVIDGTTSPISGDFTVFGGIYRDVSIRLTQPVYVGEDEASDFGLKLTPSNISKESADLDVAAKVINTATTAKNVTAKITLRNPSEGDVQWIDELPDEYLRFNKADMTPGGTVETKTLTFEVAANSTYDLAHKFVIANPHLWSGLEDPYRYIVDVELSVDGAVIDTISEFVGIREFTVDREQGGFLNGENYNLRGVSRHQDREDMGWALTKKEHNEDIAMIYMVGANAIRLAHYPQSNYTYELCDQYGLCVWAEISLVNGIGGDGTYEAPDATRVEFFKNVRQELKEMVLQQYNHPSIVVWGIQNECHGLDNIYKDFMNGLNDLAHELDTTRLTTMASNNGSSSYWGSDALAFNMYPGWYGETVEDMDSMVQRSRDGDILQRPFGISEYGLGCNPLHHSEDETMVCSQSTAIQTQEYQCYGHEKIYADIQEMDYLWGTFIWAMFDFCSDWRHEGATNGTNTKGLVNRDHSTPKDSFYFYQANWSDVPMVHLNSKDFTERENTTVNIKSYSNCDSVTLYLNGEVVSTLTKADLEQTGVFKWENVTLAAGENTVKVVATKDGKEYTDETVWNRLISGSTDITSETVKFSVADKAVWMTEAMTVGSVLSAIAPVQRAVISVCDAQGNAITDNDTKIAEGMILKIVSENGENTVELVFTRTNIAYGKTVTVSSIEEGQGGYGEKLVDGDTSTRWIALLTGGVKYPEHFIVDLGDVYNLDQLDLYWLVSGNRSYYYYVYTRTSETEEWSLVADLTENTTPGKVSTVLENTIQARYIYVYVVGNSHTTPVASCYEIMAYGWRVAPTAHSTITDSVITLKSTTETINSSNFERYVTIDGTCDYTLETKTDGVIAAGDSLVITHNGNTVTYTFDVEIVEEPVVDQQVEDVIAAIEALPLAADVVAADAEKINAANALYEALTDVQKSEVTNAQKLFDALKALDELDPPTPPTPSTVLFGNVNGDNKIDASDALVVLKYAVNKVQLTDEQKEAADVNGDDGINSADALLILKKIVNKIEKFPVEE